MVGKKKKFILKFVNCDKKLSHLLKKSLKSLEKEVSIGYESCCFL